MSYKVDLLNKSTLSKIKEIEVVNEPEIYEEINGSYTLDFDAHYTAKNDLTENVIVFVDGKYFKIAKVTKSRTDTITLSVHCEHISYALITNFELNEDMEFESDAKTMIDGFLEGTRFKLLSCPATDARYYRTKTLDIRKRLFEVANLFECELIFDNFNVSLVYERGTDKGLDVELGINLIGVTEEIDFVEGTTSYELDLVDLSGVSGREANFAAAEIGDTITIIDNVLGIRSNERIIAIRYNPFKKALPTVTVGDYIPDFVQYVKDEIEEEEEEPEEKDIYSYFKQFKIDGIDLLKQSSEANGEVMNYLSNRHMLGIELTTNYNSLKKELTGIVAEKSSDARGILSVVQTKINARGLIETSITEITSPTQLSSVKISDITNVILVLSQKSLSYYRANTEEIKDAGIVALGICVTFNENDGVFLDKFNVGRVSALGLTNGNCTALIKRFIQDGSNAPIAPAQIEITARLTGIEVVPTSEFLNWHLTLIHSVKEGSSETWSYGFYELPLVDNADFEVTAYEKDSVIVVVSNEPFGDILLGTASDDVYFQAYGATFVFGEAQEGGSDASDYMSEFRTGDLDLLSIASDETEQVNDFIRNMQEVVIASSQYTFKRDENLTGLFAQMRSEYSDYHFTLLDTYVANGDDGNMYTDTWETNLDESDPGRWTFNYNEGYITSYTFVISDIPFRDINQSNVDTVFLKAFGVRFTVDTEGDEEGPDEGIFLEYGKVTLREEMYIHFENGPYSEVLSVTTGYTYGSVLPGNVSVSVSEVYDGDGQIEALYAYAQVKDSSYLVNNHDGSDIYVNIQAVCKKGPRNIIIIQ